MAILLKKIKGKSIKRDEHSADWDRLLNLIKILLLLFIAFSAFHWIVQKRIQSLPKSSSLITKAAEPNNQNQTQTKLYTVRSGDTLWSIARSQYPKENAAKIVAEIENLNHLNSPIKPGQPLKLP